ncbi:WbqC family protein [Crassaminicella indica]|uniref:WbqC family protein n=1 Tax=Crassaminicella indica TaxID=2855394 RepID=A0ABX8R815_9CLOT|nr:WbqC family protein [Crassaminicella indica]QXM05179.1 WbqC family protein [Crassaminicella indica]
MMRKIAISQPRYLPACNYIERMIISDVFVMLDNVQHQKRAFEHRNRIRTTNGCCWLSIPIDRKNSKSDKIKDLLVLNDESWEENHYKNFVHNYKKTPFYDEIIKLLEEFYSKKRIYFNEVVRDMLNILINYLELKVKVEWASNYIWKCKKDDLLIEITKYFDGDIYISGPNGRNYIDKNKFIKNDIELVFHEYNHPVYNQIWGDFIPYMTIWDMLFYCGKDTVKYIKTGFLKKE